MANDLPVTLRGADELHIELNTPIPIGTRDYERLVNQPQINGITLIGNMTLSDLEIVSENTLEGWATMPSYVPKVGEVCLYTDISNIKIGNGSVPIGDLAFVGNVTPDEKSFWNAKLNYSVNGEELIFDRN